MSRRLNAQGCIKIEVVIGVPKENTFNAFAVLTMYAKSERIFPQIMSKVFPLLDESFIREVGFDYEVFVDDHLCPPNILEKELTVGAVQTILELKDNIQ